MNETVCPSTQKFPLPSNELLPVSQITLANTEADGNKNCNSILDPIVESDMVETVRPSMLKFPPPYKMIPLNAVEKY